MPRQDGNVLRIGAQWLAEITPVGIMRITEPVWRDQSFCFVVLMQKFERSREVNPSGILLPLLRMMFVEIIAQIKNVIGRHNSFASEEVDGVGHRSCIRKG